MDDAERGRLIDTVSGMMGDVHEPVLSRVFQYWKNIDQEVGEAIEKKALEGRGDDVPPGA